VAIASSTRVRLHREKRVCVCESEGERDFRKRYAMVDVVAVWVSQANDRLIGRRGEGEKELLLKARVRLSFSLSRSPLFSYAMHTQFHLFVSPYVKLEPGFLSLEFEREGVVFYAISTASPSPCFS
jgi:hypothetical protein